uniref:Uncharacterized protein n=1 Tax=Cannabis sativa TaxID=3483 RepID=A0A803QAR6_CANSA
MVLKNETLVKVATWALGETLAAQDGFRVTEKAFFFTLAILTAKEVFHFPLAFITANELFLIPSAVSTVEEVFLVNANNVL